MRIFENSNPILTSAYGYRTDIGDFHIGNDVVANTPNKFDWVVAPCDCEVGWVVDGIPGFVGNGSYGNQVVLNLGIIKGHEYKLRYAHFQNGTIPVKFLDTIKAGQRIGYMGATGNIFGAHVHIEVIVDGKTVDPYDYIFGNKFDELFEQPKPLFTIEKVPTKKVKYKKDVSLWDLSFTSFSNAVAVNHYKKDAKLEVGAIATHVVGSKYYISKYDYDNKINNGVNVDDCYDYVEAIIEETPVVKEEQPTEVIEVPVINDSEQQDKQTNQEPSNTTKEPEASKIGVLTLVIDILKKVIEIIKGVKK